MSKIVLGKQKCYFYFQRFLEHVILKETCQSIKKKKQSSLYIHVYDILLHTVHYGFHSMGLVDVSCEFPNKKFHFQRLGLVLFIEIFFFLHFPLVADSLLPNHLPNQSVLLSSTNGSETFLVGVLRE